MTRLTKLRRFWREERGVTAVLTSMLLTSLVGIAGSAVDMGVIFTAKAQLQNAADAAALAAANTMVGVGANNNAIAQPSIALNNAEALSSANQALGVHLDLKQPPGDDFIIGLWDQNAGNFDPAHTGLGINNPDDLTAARVRVRRDSLANTPVGTYFARVLGINQVNLAATSTAFLGWPGQVPAGIVDLPIAIISTAISNGGGPDCGKGLTFHSDGDQNSEWTTFFTWPANNPNVDAYVNGQLPIPALAVGDQVNLTNGNLSNGTFNDLVNRFNQEQSGGQWTVTLPVIGAPGMGANQGTIVGFASFTITQVRPAPFKDLTGHLACQMVVPNTPTGGGNFGTRAAAAKLIR